MFVIRMLVIGIFLAGVLAGIGALADSGAPGGITGALLVGTVLVVGLRMIGGLFSRSENDSTSRKGSPAQGLDPQRGMSEAELEEYARKRRK